MASRREFIHAGVAAAVLPLTAEMPIASDSMFYKVIFDHRFSASVQFAAEMAARGVPIHGIHGEITGLWYHDLYHRWNQGPTLIAGMTPHAALFCLERLAWNQGMRVLSRTESLPKGASEPLIAWTIGRKCATDRYLFSVKALPCAALFQRT
jgi:hypothetical protein